MDNVETFVDDSREFQAKLLDFVSRFDEREKKRERFRSVARALTIGALSSAIGWFAKHWKW